MKKTSLILAIVLIVGLLGSAPAGIAFAATNVYSFVLDDLQADSTFDEFAYPAIDNDYSLNVIQVAESSDGELFVYTYQPSSNAYVLMASSITLARGISGKDYSQDLSFVNYKLTYLNSSGVFYKYKITNFQLSTDNVRYYNVASISRPWDKIIDEPASAGNTVSEKAYEVGMMWTATSDGDNVTYAKQEKEVVQITSKVVGYVNYSDGWEMSFGSTTEGATSAHFVAFSTDWQIDQLMEVEVSFNTQEVSYKYCTNFLHSHFKKKYDYVKGDVVPHDNIVLHDYEKAGNSAGLNFAEKHEWARIMTASDFLLYHDFENGECQLLTDDKENIKRQQWVLSFYETPILTATDVGWDIILNPLSGFWKNELTLKYTEVSDVVILRLMFQKAGTTYNLGVVDNKQTGSGKPSNVSNAIADLKDALAQITGFVNKAKTLIEWLVAHWQYIVIGLVGLGIVIGIIVGIVKACLKFGAKAVFKVLGKIILLAVKLVLLPFTLLFYGISALVKQRITK